MTTLDLADALQPRRRAPVVRLPRILRRRVVLTPGGMIGILLVCLVIGAALLGPALTADPTRQSLRDRLQPPSSAHWLGTDNLGRDLLARVVTGARVSLLVGLVTTSIALVIGAALGMVAGLRGGRVDLTILFFTDVQLALPFVLVAIGLVAVRGNHLSTVIATLVITAWVPYTRILRLQTLTLRSAPFIDAARAMGAGSGRVIRRHLAPNLAPPTIVIASQQVAAVILFEAALSFLGLGVPASTITWGRMISDGRESLATAWWVSAVPGIAIAITVLGCNLLGDWLQLQLDPRARQAARSSTTTH